MTRVFALDVGGTFARVAVYEGTNPLWVEVHRTVDLRPLRDLVMDAIRDHDVEACGVAIAGPDGRLVRILRAPGPMARGFHSALWRGDDEAGRPVVAGPYLVRLAGPATATPASPAPAAGATTVAEPVATWPARAEWSRDHAITVAAP